MDNHAVRCFVSYSHADVKSVTALKEYLSSRVGTNNISLWYDRMIDVGTEWSAEIESQLLDAELVLFCISGNFINSTSCLNEFRKSLKLRKEKNTQIVPVIVKKCEWSSYEEISKYQATPSFGNPIEEYADKHTAYEEIVSCLNEKVALIQRRNALKFTENQAASLDSIDSLLSISGSSRLNLRLTDVYVAPELQDYKYESDDNVVAAGELIDKLIEGEKIIISGESQAGKSSLCKKICLDLFQKSFYPVLLTAENSYLENSDEVIDRALFRQYTDPKAIGLDRVILILDDFYKGRQCERFLNSIPKVHSIVAVFDDIYYFNLKNVRWLSDFHAFGLLPMRARKRSELIIKWLASQNEEHHEPFDNYKSRDRLVENIEFMLGKTFGKGIVPAYPFFILSILITSEVAFKPINQQITSQGYCYQALIHSVLRKVGVDNLHVDFYIMFLTELAYMLYKNNDSMTCSEDELLAFVKKYKDDYNLPLPEKKFIETLAKARIFEINSIGNGDFSYSYLKYYFIGKKLSEQYSSYHADVLNVLSNLGKYANAYIAIFIALQGNNEQYLDSLKDAALRSFQGIEPCYLSKSDLDGFEVQNDLIVNAALPKADINPELKREEILAERERQERKLDRQKEDEVKDNSDIGIALRLCQVMGMILKCRPGSIRKSKQKEMLGVIVDLHARLVRDFFDTFKDEEQQRSIVEYLTNRFRQARKAVRDEDPSEDRNLMRKWFWNINFMVTFGLVVHCANSIGSSELYPVIKECFAGENDRLLRRVMPFIVEIFYKKRIDIDKLSSVYKGLPKTLKLMFRYVVVRYYTTHKVKFDERQQIESLFEFKPTLPMFLKNDAKFDSDAVEAEQK